MKVERDFSITGTTFIQGATVYVERLRLGAELTLVREPTNKYDANAIAVHHNGNKIGFVPAGLAKELAPLIDSGIVVRARRKADKRYGVCQFVYETGE